MSTYRIIAELASATEFVFALMLDGGATGVKGRLSAEMPDTPAAELLERAANLAETFPCTLNLLPGYDAGAAAAMAAANSWTYNDALNPAEQAAITAARALP